MAKQQPKITHGNTAIPNHKKSLKQLKPWYLHLRDSFCGQCAVVYTVKAQFCSIQVNVWSIQASGSHRRTQSKSMINGIYEKFVNGAC